ncbi:MAG: c-type cytochrome [Phycisphaerales bacterium]|nr:c-type cytochrome [Phycisphaerales bacterium]
MGGYTPVVVEDESVEVPEGRLTLAMHVRPILESRCYECHGPETQKAGLRFDTDAFLDATGDDQIVVPGMPATSEIVKRITMPAGVKGVMPPKGETLSPEQVALIVAWIERGAERE